MASMVVPFVSFVLHDIGGGVIRFILHDIGGGVIRFILHDIDGGVILHESPYSQIKFEGSKFEPQGLKCRVSGLKI